ncbi:MAG: ABC transporter substrate-binding protein [Pseudomonadota bacterium]
MSGPDRRFSRISRRSLIGSGAVASALAVAGLPSGAAERRGGTLRIAAPLDLFDRLVAPGAVFDTLAELDEGGALRGVLAEAWETQDAGRDWTIRLRQDAVFHDGRPVTAADVVASLMPHMRESGPLRHVRRLRASDWNVQIGLNSPDTQLPLRLTDPALVIRPEAPPRETVGSGFYRVLDTEPGRVKLVRVDNHGRKARGGYFDRVELLAMDDPADRLAALEAGRVDLAFDLPAHAARALLRHRRLVTGDVPVSVRETTVRVGYATRLRGLEGRDPLRIAERGYFA